MTRPGKAVDNRVALLGAADNSALLPAPSVAEAQGTSGGGDRMRAVQEQVEGVKGVMQQNVNQMLDNMDRAQHLETTTQELAGYPDPNSNTLTLTSPNPNPNPNPTGGHCKVVPQDGGQGAKALLAAKPQVQGGGVRRAPDRPHHHPRRVRSLQRECGRRW